jgi:hypothetical protein
MGGRMVGRKSQKNNKNGEGVEQANQPIKSRGVTQALGSNNQQWVVQQTKKQNGTPWSNKQKEKKQCGTVFYENAKQCFVAVESFVFVNYARRESSNGIRKAGLLEESGKRACVCFSKTNQKAGVTGWSKLVGGPEDVRTFCDPGPGVLWSAEHWHPVEYVCTRSGRLYIIR